MSGALRPYPKYKESGVEWLGLVPEGWEVVPYKYVGTHNDEVLLESTPDDFRFDYIEIGNVTIDDWIHDHSEVSFGNAPSRARRIARIGDVLVSTVRTYLKAIAIVPDREIPYVASTGFAVLRPGKRLASSYLGRIVQSDYFVSEVIARSVGVSYPAINASEVVALPIPFPPLPEQQAIADYLDAETQRIDTLIAELREMIRLLKEKRQALISHCVTKGLDPTLPMKDSGVEWLGEVPERWEVVPVRYVIDSIEQGWSPQCYPYPAGENEWGVLKVGCVNSGTFRPQENKALPEDLAPREWLSIKNGDVLVSRANTRALVGSTAVASEDYPRLLLSDKIYRLRVNTRSMTPGFLGLQLRGPAARALIELNASGASDSMQNISQETLIAVRLAVPPPPEQHAIAAHVDRETAKIDRLISETEETITLMQERRSALISSVVTGKLQVPGIAEPSGSTLNSRPENLP